MTAEKTPISDWPKTQAVVRKLGVKVGIRPGEAVREELMVAALAKVAGSDGAGDMLRAAGVKDVEQFLAAIPDASEEEMERLPKLKADSRLATILQGELKGLLSGKMIAVSALKVLLQPRNLTQDVRRFLMNPTKLLAYGWENEIRGTEELVQHLARYYQPRFHVGYRRYMVNASTGCSAFLRKDKEEDFAKAIGELRENEREALRAVFASSLYERSPLGTCRREYGELEAHILGAAILGDMALVAQGALSVNAIAWTIDPSHCHRLAGLVRDKVGHLRDAGLLVICPDDELRLNSHVLPSESTMDNFLVFLREEDPITDKEIRETLYRIT